MVTNTTHNFCYVPACPIEILMLCRYFICSGMSHSGCIGPHAGVSYRKRYKKEENEAELKGDKDE